MIRQVIAAQLTFIAVRASPAVQTRLGAILRARVVTELVVARLAEFGALRAVVELVARDAVAVGEDRGPRRLLRREVEMLPLLSHLHRTLLLQLADQHARRP